MMHLAGYFAIAVPILVGLIYWLFDSLAWHFGDEVDEIETTHIRKRY